MTRHLYSLTTWLSFLIDRQAWDVVVWNLQEVGIRETVTSLIDDQACMVDGLMEARESWSNMYDL